MTAVHPTNTLTAARAVAAARSRRRPRTPAELAVMLDPKFVVTPTIRLLSDIAVKAVEQPDQRDIVTTPPRTGKSRLLAIWTTVWVLANNPDLQVVLVSYSDELAQAHSREARALINEHSVALGIRLSPDKTAVGRWRVDGHAGGLLATGINSGVTGFGADVLVLDDVVKDAAEADSAAHRKRVVNEYRSTLATRVHPGGSVLLVMTRWHPEDLAGELLKSEPDVWAHTNIPAVAETGVPDALGRRPGAAMTSALGFTAEHYAAARRTSGERAWYALYQGSPTTPAGGLIKASWLDTWRLPVAPAGVIKTVVGVDPADSGQGDETGIVAASLSGDGTTALIADVSGRMTSDEWATRAVRLALDTGASEISVEAFAAGTTYVRVVREALARAKPDRHISVTAWPPKGSGRGKGDAMARAAALLQALEVGTCRLAGHHPEWEQQAVGWQAGQHQPDRVAALVIAHDVLIHAAGGGLTFGVPLGNPTSLASYVSRKIG
ncbi:gp2 protein [Mycobacteroides abscessus subsp. abscessus]|uniref:terminase large subunit domain-containing protein n=1 Tax=Mycobacteroides abscessus TaxID=36809 RepID=UPI000925D367|nr:terminase family protein [Mycobacteroides abscessus]SIL58264.1 gp2 protein [Mycobacteroides abscessus subsp. abscessus]SLC82038.1 gp2 protein [Mycobacteroides abscessus subsp. abscessus]